MNEETNKILESAFADVAGHYSGSDVDLYDIYKTMRKSSPVIEEDFMSKLGVPNIAGHDANRKTFTVFNYKDVMTV